MGPGAEWLCLLACPDEASASPIAHYLNLHDCPALVFPRPPGCDLGPTTEVRVPREFLERARHVWARAGTLPELSDGELEYLATGELPGAGDDLPRRKADDALISGESGPYCFGPWALQP